MRRIFFLLIALGAIGLLAVVTLNETPEVDARPEREIARSAQLALRQIAHELLKCNGDATTLIPAVEVTAPFEFFLPIGQPLDYDQLLSIAPGIFQSHGLELPYSLSLQDCTTNDLVLGYNWSPEMRTPNAACSGRDRPDDECHHLKLSIASAFDLPIQRTAFLPYLLLLLFGAGGLGWSLSRRNPLPDQEEPAAANSSQRKISARTTFDVVHQQLTIDEQPIELTFREAKLLNYLVEHTNEVLDRETIHAAVWGSEGVMVGRSLDVFISRLRKKMAPDGTIEIGTIHGIGYRLTVS